MSVTARRRPGQIQRRKMARRALIYWIRGGKSSPKSKKSARGKVSRVDIVTRTNVLTPTCFGEKALGAEGQVFERDPPSWDGDKRTPVGDEADGSGEFLMLSRCSSITSLITQHLLHRRGSKPSNPDPAKWFRTTTRRGEVCSTAKSRCKSIALQRQQTVTCLALMPFLFLCLLPVLSRLHHRAATAWNHGKLSTC